MKRIDLLVIFVLVGAIAVLMYSCAGLTRNIKEARYKHDRETYEAWVKYSKREDISYEEWHRLKNQNLLKNK